MHLHSSATHTSCPSALTDLPPRSSVTGHAGGSIHDITAATLAVPLAILVASQLSRSTLSWWPPDTSTSSRGGWAHTCMGQYTALVGLSLAVYFQASVLLAVLLIATLLPPQVLPTRCACLRQLTERTDGCIGGYEGPWACQHTLLGLNAAPLSPSQRRRLN